MNKNGTCETCQENFYKTNGHCCRRGSVYLTSSCQKISDTSLNTLTNCIQISKPTETTVECDVCKEGYHSTNGKCCLMSEYYDTVSSSCISYEFIENCANFNSSYICS